AATRPCGSAGAAVAGRSTAPRTAQRTGGPGRVRTRSPLEDALLGATGTPAPLLSPGTTASSSLPVHAFWSFLSTPLSSAGPYAGPVRLDRRETGSRPGPLRRETMNDETK